jgi:predicted short-subunit dehydrogenase-like oxidoreductase (DUF2520 family)
MNGVERPGALALVGPGRAGTTIAATLAAVGWRVVAVAGRDPDAASTGEAASLLGAPVATVEDAARAADLIVIGTADAAIEAVAAQLAGTVPADTLVIHLSGARGLDALAPLSCRVGALHPLQTFPTVEAGLARLPGSWCAVSGDPQVAALAEQLQLRPVELQDADRVRYHAAACIASNHLVALLEQVRRVSPVPLEAFLPLVRATVDNVDALGPEAALTGPVARGDVDTVRAHVDALPDDHVDAYRALARAAAVLCGRTDAELDAVIR